MGLPVWRAPSPEPRDQQKTARSPIRRRRLGTTSPRLRDHNVHAAASHLARADSSTRRSSSARPYPPPPPVTDAPRRLPLTPNFAPAHGPRRLATTIPPPRDGDEITGGRGLPPRHLGIIRYARGPRGPTPTRDTPSADEEESSDNAVGFPPLRRMGRRTIADGPLPASSLRESWSPATTLDGLGDRDRSLSPVVDDHWETMLTSVAPDPLAPTAESSFTSAAASASFSNSHPSSRAGSSNSNSVSSSRTHLTVPSRRQSWSFDQFLHACDTSEDDSASDTEEEDMEAYVAAGLSRLRSAARTASNEPPPQNPHRYSRVVRERSRESTAYVRSFYGEVTSFDPPRRMEERVLHGQPEGPVEERNMTDEEMPLDQELRDARALIERLARREDIPDDFWASVGLRRPVADRVERIQRLL